jgi:16S rRNA processing protein RimM
MEPLTGVAIGVVGRARGLRGEVRVKLFDSASRTLFAKPEVYLVSRDGDRSGPWVVEHAVEAGSDAWVRLSAATRDAAMALRGMSVVVERHRLPELQPDEAYDVDLVGAAVVDVADRRVGTVRAVEHPPANDVLVVELDGTRRWLDVPMIGSVVLEIDPRAGRVRVDLPDGLPDRARR